jgi:hypothetical protein
LLSGVVGLQIAVCIFRVVSARSPAEFAPQLSDENQEAHTNRTSPLACEPTPAAGMPFAVATKL